MELSRNSSHATAERMLSIALAIYAYEMVIGGPGFINGGLFSPRFLFFSLVSLATFNYFFQTRLLLDAKEKRIIWLLVIFLLIWTIAIPLAKSSNQAKNAARECLFFLSSFTGILLIKIAHTNPAIFKKCGRATLLSLDIVATTISTIWIIGAIYPELQIPLNTGIRVLLRPLGPPNDLPIYIGPMPDGAFRVMWITSTLICLGAIYALQRGMPLRSALYLVACAASYARGIWLALALGILLLTLIELIKNRKDFALWARRATGLTLGLMISILLLYLHNHEPTARLTLDDSATNIRMTQLDALTKLWISEPLLGQGFGAFSQAIIRNPEMPWSYEMTYPALLMKIGLVGTFLLLLCGHLVIKYAIKESDEKWLIFPYLLTIFIYSGTNPYLLNIVGFSALFCVLLMFSSHHKMNPPQPNSAPSTIPSIKGA